MTIREHYRSPGYRLDRVAKRYVRRIHPACACGLDHVVHPFRVYECTTGNNRNRQLARVGAGPTIREYDCGAEHLPRDIIDRLPNRGEIVPLINHRIYTGDIAMIIRVETFSVTRDGMPDDAVPPTTRDIDYRRKADRVWLAKHSQWAFNNGRGVQTYRVA